MLWVSGGLAGGQRIRSQPGETQTFPNGPLRSPERPPVLLQEERAGKEERRERRAACAQRLKSDKVCRHRKPEQGVCACVLGCSAVAKGEEASDHLAILQAGKGFPPKLANPSKSIPACWTPK